MSDNINKQVEVLKKDSTTMINGLNKDVQEKVNNL